MIIFYMGMFAGRGRMVGLCVALCCWLGVVAQTARLFEGDEYLCCGAVNDLVQDEWGAVWVAGEEGLTRYDGHGFRTYRRDGSERGLVSGHVRRLVEDGRRRLVVGTASGVQRFDPATLRFTEVRLMAGGAGEALVEKKLCYVNALLRRGNGDVLIATSGYGVFVLKEGDEVARSAEEMLRHREFVDVKSMAEGKDGVLWVVGRSGGVLRLAGKERRVYEKGRRFQSVCVDGHDGVYACGAEGGLFRYDAEKDVMVEVAHDVPSGRLVAARDGGVLVATDGEGLMRWDGRRGVLSPCEVFLREMDMGRAKTTAVLEDRDGNLWLGVRQKGLVMQPRRSGGFGYMGANFFPSQSDSHTISRSVWIGEKGVSAVCMDGSGTLWVGTDGDGLYRISSDGTSRHVSDAPAAVLGICEDREGRLYVASWLNGCGRLEGTTGRYEQLPCTKEGDACHVMSVVVDRDGVLWMATNGDGLKGLNLRTGELEEYRAVDVAELDERQNALSNNWINHLALSPDSARLYVAMSSSMGCLDLRTRSFIRVWGRNCLLSGVAVNGVCEDRHGRVWAATAEGLYTCRGDGGELRRFGTAEGLPSDGVMSVEVAADGTLWLGTRHGLCHFFPEKNMCVNFWKSDGLQGNEFVKGASAVLRDGRLAFGGTGGLTLFRPEDIRVSHPDLKVRLVGMTVSGEEVCTLTRSGWWQVTDTVVGDAARFDLAYHDNSFTLSFSAMDYARADGIRYEYTMGDGRWTSLPVGTNVLAMTHLAAGTYAFAVRAVAGSDVGEERRFTVVVHPAWYASWWAKMLYALLVVWLVWYYLHRRRRMEQQRLRVQERIHAVQMAQAERMAEEQRAVVREQVESMVTERMEMPTLQTPDERLLERVVQVVNAHMDDAGLSVEMVASEVGISRAHLHRKMKELTGESTRDFVRNVRLKRAAYLLEGGCHSIAEVMYACGFDSPSGFSTRFKNFYGVSPSEYRDGKAKK